MSKVTASTLIILLASLLNGCNDNEPSSNTSATDTPSTVCYAGKFPGEDSAIELTIDKNNVTGYYAWSPHEKDGSFGKLVGTIDNGKITAKYTYVIEGSRDISEVAFTLKGKILSQGSGELIEKKGELVFKNPSDIKWENPHEEINCDKVSKLIGYARDAVK